MKKLGNFGGAFLLTLSLCSVVLPIAAQTASPTLTALNNFEQSIMLGDILPAVTPNLPPNVMASLTGGALDLRTQTNYNPQSSTLTMTFFTVQTGSPSPTNLTQVNPTNLFGSLSFSTDRIYVTSKSVQFVGAVTNGSSSPFGSFQSTPYSISFAYSGTPPTFTNAMIELAGTLVLLSPTATGTVTITQPSSTGGTGSTGVTIVTNIAGSAVVGTNSFEVGTNQIMLDASQSTSSNPGPLTYSWSVAPNFLSAVVIGSTQAAPLIELSAKGTYQFNLTVTDSTGVSSTATITVQFI